MARALQHHLPNSDIIGSNIILTQFSGDPQTQGHWPAIFAQGQHQWHHLKKALKLLANPKYLLELVQQLV